MISYEQLTITSSILCCSGTRDESVVHHHGFAWNKHLGRSDFWARLDPPLDGWQSHTHRHRSLLHQSNFDMSDLSGDKKNVISCQSQRGLEPLVAYNKLRGLCLPSVNTFGPTLRPILGKLWKFFARCFWARRLMIWNWEMKKWGDVCPQLHLSLNIKHLKGPAKNILAVLSLLTTLGTFKIILIKYYQNTTLFVLSLLFLWQKGKKDYWIEGYPPRISENIREYPIREYPGKIL